MPVRVGTDSRKELFGGHSVVGGHVEESAVAKTNRDTMAFANEGPRRQEV